LILSRWALLAPWWARRLANAVFTAVLSTAFAALFFPGFASAAAWPWKAAAMIGAGLAVSATLAYAQQPLRDSYTTPLTGLTRPQQESAITAVRRGQIPADPAVLAAAIRVGAVSVASLRRGAQQQKTAKWLVPLLYLAPGVWNLVDGDTRKGLLWIGFSVYFAIYFAVLSFRTRHLPDHVQQLRAAAVVVPAAAAVLAETAGSAPLPPRWQWQWRSLPIAVVTVACFVGATYFWGPLTLNPTSLHWRDCATSAKVVEFVDRHPEMLNAERIAPGEPGLPAYQEWTDQLHTFAESVNWAELAQHLDRVADLSAHAVSVVHDFRQDTSPSVTSDAMRAHENDYQKTVSALITELGDATPVCRRDP
jgi:hypothetical protein